MRLVTYRQNIESEARLGATDGDWVVDLQKFGSAYGLSIPSTMLGFIDLGPQASTILGPLVGQINGLYPLGRALPLANVTLLAPSPRPPQNPFGIGLNYPAPVANSAKSLNHTPNPPP